MSLYQSLSHGLQADVGIDMGQKEVGNETSRYLVVGSSAAGCMRCGHRGSECCEMSPVGGSRMAPWRPAWIFGTRIGPERPTTETDSLDVANGETGGDFAGTRVCRGE